jgi:PPOX class probable F420-dependent enzyme
MRSSPWSIATHDWSTDVAGRPQKLPDAIARKLQQARVARLATIDAERRPHIVPICFAFDGKVFYTAIDEKPKRASPQRLTRLRNIRRRPRVALLIDHYEDDWTRLWYVLIRGEAKLLPASERRQRASALRRLRAKYPQYARGLLSDEAPIIRIRPLQTTWWAMKKS